MSENDNQTPEGSVQEIHYHGEVETPITGARHDRRRGDIHEPEDSSQIWLISFTDVMALMLTFFVLLFSMTEPAKDDWSQITSAMQSEFNKFYGAPMARGTQDTIDISRIDYNRALNIGYLTPLIESVIADNELLADAVVIPRRDHLILALPEGLLFDAGQADVKEPGARALYALGGSLSRIRNVIEIAGHADPRPVSGGDYESNWDLSLTRAINVAAILENVGYEHEIKVRGHASGRYEDLAAIEDEGQRMDIARRVDIVIRDHDSRNEKVDFRTPEK